MPSPSIQIRPTRHHGEISTPSERAVAARLSAACAAKPVRRIQSTADITARPLRLLCAAPVTAKFTEPKTARAPGEYQKEIKQASINAIASAIGRGRMTANEISRQVHLEDSTVRRILVAHPDLFACELVKVEGVHRRTRRWGVVA
jgi:hypothetical protein